DAAVEVDHFVVEHADAARRGGQPDGARLVGAVDAIERVPAALVEIERAGAQRVARTAFHARGKLAAVLDQFALDHVGGRMPGWPLALGADLGHARPLEALAADADAILDGLAVAENVVQAALAGV